MWLLQEERPRKPLLSRYPNSFLAAPKFKNETIEVVLEQIVEPNDLMITTDISKAYYAVPLDEHTRPYFCFEHAGVVLCPKMLVFGMNEAPYFFNKIMRVVIQLARNLNIRMSSYFDDQIWFAASEEEAKNLVQQAKIILEKMGWLLNENFQSETGTKQKSRTHRLRDRFREDDRSCDQSQSRESPDNTHRNESHKGKDDSP